jgi:hypothetical protein
MTLPCEEQPKFELIEHWITGELRFARALFVGAPILNYCLKPAFQERRWFK